MAGEVSLHQLLQSTVITRAISLIRIPRQKFQRFFGMNMGGPFVNDAGGKHLGWDIFDHTRMISKGRPPGAGPARATAQKVGHVAAMAYRTFEAIHMDQERIFRTRPIGGQWGQIDVRGQSYVTRQERYLAQRFSNNREFMISRMVRGGFGVLLEGEDWIPVELGAGTFDVDYQVPAGNKAQLDMLGGGDIIDASWITATTDVKGHCLAINSAFEQLHGYPLRHVFINSTLANSLLENTGLQAVGGTANTIFNTFRPEGAETAKDRPADVTDLVIVFRALPWLTFHVYDAVLETNGVATKTVPDVNAAFLPDPGPDLYEWINGSEIVAENVMDAGTERFGFYSYSTRTIDPAGWDLKAIDVGLPAVYIPKAIAWGTVVF